MISFRQRARDTPNLFHKFIFFLNSLKLRRHEKKLSLFCQEIWLISPPDQKEYLARNLTAANRLVTPTFDPLLTTTRIKRFLKGRDQNLGTVTLGYLGGLDFGPNKESARWILAQLAPALQKRNFNGKILIAGRNPPPDIMKWAEAFPFVEILGFLENTEEFWSRLSWMLVPHITGSGVRMKLLEALASGVPALAHPAAVDRLNPALHNHLGVVVCATIEDWVEKIMSEQPFTTRNQLTEKFPADRGFPGLMGREIYSFLPSAAD